jgi:hypothetical protein
VRVNDTLATLNGIPVHDHIARSVAEVLPALWPEIEPYYHRVLDTGEAVLNVEITGRTAALPNVRHFAATFYPLRSGADLIGIGVLVNDITERKKAQRGVVIIDATGVIRLVNRQAEALSVARRSNQRESATHAGARHL